MPDLVDVRIPVTDVMSQALCTRMESWRDRTFQRSILVVSVGPLSTLNSFSAGPILIAHIILIHVQRVTYDIRTALVTLLFALRLIVLLGLIATLSAFGVLHCGLQEYRMPPLRKGRDRHYKTHPKHATSTELVKIVHQFSTAVPFDEVCAMPNAKMTSLRMMAPRKRRELQFSATRLEDSAHGGPIRADLGLSRLNGEVPSISCALSVSGSDSNPFRECEPCELPHPVARRVSSFAGHSESWSPDLLCPDTRLPFQTLQISVQDGTASVLNPDGQAAGIDHDLQTCGQTDDVVCVGQGVRLIEIVDTPTDAALGIPPGSKTIHMQIPYRENLRCVTQFSAD
jgi:hypothetical protein